MILQKKPNHYCNSGLVLKLVLVMFFMLIGSEAISQPNSEPIDNTWSQLETQNFVILATDARQRDYVGKSIEFMRKWEFDRWGMKQVDFSVKCMILIANDKNEYKKLFKDKDIPTVQIDRTQSGKIKAMTIWCWAEPNYHVSVIPQLLTEVCLAEFEQKHDTRFPLWVHRGMSILNGNVPLIKRNVADLSQVYAQNLPCFWSEDIFNMTEDKLEKYQPQNKQWYDKQAATMCLFVLKNHGQKKFLDFVDGSIKDPQSALSILGFSGYKEIDIAYNKFMYNLSRDTAAGNNSDGNLNWLTK